MAKNDNLQDLLQSVADAIRAKKGTTGTINAQDFDSEIASISGGGSGIADSTKTLVNAISGVTPTDETTLNNAIAKAYADTPSEQKWNGTRSTAEGGTIKDGVAFVESVKGSTMKYKQEAVAIGSRNPVNGITRTNIDAQTIKVSGTSTSSANYTITENYTSIAGHKYLAVLVGMPLTCGCRGSARLGHNSSIYTQGSSATTADIGMYIPSGVALDSEIKPMLFDLTEMGLNSHTEPDEVAKVFGYADCESMPFMGYQPTTKLLNFTHNTITSKDEDNATLDTLSLNVPTSVFPNGMNGVGTAYDEWKPAEGKAIKRIGKVDLGTLTWYVTSVANRFYATLPSDSYMYMTDNPRLTYVCAKYLNKYTSLPTADEDKMLCLANRQYAYIRDTAYTTASDFKTAMSGVMLYYELAEPTETTTDKAKAFFKVANGGTESISGGTDSAPIKAVIGYRGMSAEELVNAINI